MSDRPFDLEAVARDDELLDLLAAGLRPDSPDPVMQALYTWRNDLTAGVGAPPALPHDTRPARVMGVAKVTRAGVNDGTANRGTANGARRNGVARANGVAHPGVASRMTPASPPAADDPGDETDAPGAVVRRPGRRRAAAAAIVVGLSAGLGGVAVAAADAGPGSPLWPITKMIYADSAADRQHEADAETALARARKALADGRVSEAERYLDEAGRHAASSDSRSAGQLRDEVAAVREQLQEKENNESQPSPDPAPTDEPSDPGDDAEAPLTTPPLPTPSTTADNGQGEDPGKDRGSAKDNRDRGANGKARPESTSSEMQLLPEGTVEIPRSLPEF